MKKNKILDSESFQRTVNRLAHEVVERNKGTENLALVGIRTRGEFLAQRLAKKIEEIEGKGVQVGILDITLYRDDLRGRLDQPQLKSTEIPSMSPARPSSWLMMCCSPEGRSERR